MESISSSNQTQQQRRETREIVTPYAFKVADELLGIPLATPFRRGVALLIDLTLVALLTHVSTVFLAGLVSILFFRAGNRLKQKKRFNGARIALRLLTALMLFVFALGLFGVFNADNYSLDGEKVNGLQVSALQGLKIVTLTTKYVAEVESTKTLVSDGECSPAYSCWSVVGENFAEDLAKLSISSEEAIGLFSVVVDAAEEQLDDAEKTTLYKQMEEQYYATKSTDGDTELETVEETLDERTEETAPDENQMSQPIEESSYSVIEWLMGAAKDLGIGFGWAAFYFSAFTFWLKGKTPGKFLLGIKVIKIDAKELSLWESFERYGGYGAGLATGLSGFLRIFWDPNRQGIHDKISETVVINTRKEKVNLEYLDLGESSKQSA